MRKTKTIQGILVFLAMMVMSVGVSAQTWDIGLITSTDVKATFSNGTLTISGTGYMKSWLSSIDYPDYGAPWFYLRANITKVVINEGVTNIGNYAFQWCGYMTSITIPNSVTNISENAFYGCGLTSVTIPDGVTSISDSAFFNCSNLKSVTIGNGVTSIGVRAFYNCKSLKSVTIPDGVRRIRQAAFEQCDSLTSVVIGDKVEKISSYTFRNCRALTSVIIGSSITSIDTSAFEVCESLTSVTIPDNVTNIGPDAFSSCTSLTSITIGNGVTSIGDRAFDYCWELTSITIPDNVTSIGQGTFIYCSKLTSVICLSSVPPVLTGIDFRGTETDIYVASYDSYLSADKWKDLESRLKPLCEHDDYDHNYLNAPTCTETGTCEYCGSTGALGHLTPDDYNSGASATCTTASTRIKICERDACSEVLVSENQEALGHIWAETYTIINPATETEAGLQAKLCTRDDCTEQTDEQVIPATGATPINKAQKSDSRYGIKFASNIVSDKAEISVVLPNNDKATKTNIVVYDMTGNVVYSATGNNNIVWDLTNSAGRTVANGTYLVIAEVKSQNGQNYRYSAKLGVKK